MAGFANLGTYSWIRVSNGGWNRISNNVIITDVDTGLGAAPVQIIGIYKLTCPEGRELLGRVQVFGPGGQMLTTNAQLNSNWGTARILMNTDYDVWNHGGATREQRLARYRHTVIHEAGHVLKLQHPSCSGSSVMHQGFPNNAGGPNRNSPQVATHDRNALIARWGAPL
jgi:hypothetical protein